MSQEQERIVYDRRGGRTQGDVEAAGEWMAKQAEEEMRPGLVSG